MSLDVEDPEVPIADELDEVIPRARYPKPLNVVDYRTLSDYDPNKFTIVIHCHNIQLGDRETKEAEVEETKDVSDLDVDQDRAEDVTRLEFVRPLNQAALSWSRIMASLKSDKKRKPLPIASGMSCYPKLVFDSLGQTDGQYDRDRMELVTTETMYESAQSVAGIMQMGISRDVVNNNIDLFSQLGDLFSNGMMHSLVTNMDNILISEAFKDATNNEGVAMFASLHAPEKQDGYYRMFFRNKLLMGDDLHYVDESRGIDEIIEVDDAGFNFFVVWPGHGTMAISAKQYKAYIGRQQAFGAYTYARLGKYPGSDEDGFDVEHELDLGEVRTTMSDLACAVYMANSFIEMGDAQTAIVKDNT